MFEQLAALTDELDRLEADLPGIYASGDRRAARDAGRRHRELKPDEERLDPAHDEKGQRRHHVKNADALVVDR